MARPCSVRFHPAVALTACIAAASAGPVGAAAIDRVAAASTSVVRTLPPIPADFVVEWRLRPVDAATRRGDIEITSGSATTGGSSGFGPGAVVVGTARPGVPQSVRVANGREGAIRFDDAQTHAVYDMSYAATSRSRSDADASGAAVPGPASPVTSASRSQSHAESQSREQGASSHDVVVHRVDGLRVTPHWTGGDTLELDVQLTHVAPRPLSGPTDAGSRAGRDIDFHSTVRIAFDEWQSVASVGGGGDELQIRVNRR